MHSPEESSPASYYQTCVVCDEEFSSDTDLANHLIEHANDEEFKISLQEFDREAEAITARKKNFSKRSGSPEVFTISDDSEDEPAPSEPNPKKPTTFQGILASHSAASTTSQLNAYNCKPCQLGFKDIKQYKKHLALHDKIKPYACDICSRRFAYGATLRQHLRMHVAKKSHECKICNKKFSMKRVLMQHEATHHMMSTT